jgi:hypothetical protein
MITVRLAAVFIGDNSTIYAPGTFGWGPFIEEKSKKAAS